MPLAGDPTRRPNPQSVYSPPSSDGPRWPVGDQRRTLKRGLAGGVCQRRSPQGLHSAVTPDVRRSLARSPIHRDYSVAWVPLHRDHSPPRSRVPAATLGRAKSTASSQKPQPEATTSATTSTPVTPREAFASTRESPPPPPAGVPPAPSDTTRRTNRGTAKISPGVTRSRTWRTPYPLRDWRSRDRQNYAD